MMLNRNHYALNIIEPFSKIKLFILHINSDSSPAKTKQPNEDSSISIILALSLLQFGSR